jgi:hypothetical protein
MSYYLKLANSLNLIKFNEDGKPQQRLPCLLMLKEMF